MDDLLRQEILKAEDILIKSVKEEVIVSKAYDVGFQHDLSISQIALIVFPYLLNEVKRLRIMARDWSNEKDFKTQYKDQMIVELTPCMTSHCHHTKAAHCNPGGSCCFCLCTQYEADESVQEMLRSEPIIEVCGNSRHGWKARMTCVLPLGHTGNHEDSTMTVSELREKLLEFDQNAEIVIQNPDEVMILHPIESFGYVPSRLPRKCLVINAAYFESALPEKID